MHLIRQSSNPQRPAGRGHSLAWMGSIPHARQTVRSNARVRHEGSPQGRQDRSLDEVTCFRGRQKVSAVGQGSSRPAPSASPPRREGQGRVTNKGHSSGSHGEEPRRPRTVNGYWLLPEEADIGGGTATDLLEVTPSRSAGHCGNCTCRNGAGVRGHAGA
jgi:hypothetical protein